MDSDRGTFDRAFGRVYGAFRLKFTGNEAEELTQTYYKLLEPYPLDVVLLAGKNLMTVSRKFPYPADWVAAVVALVDGRRASPTPDLRQMSATELDAYAAADQARWAGPRCACGACVHAHVDHLPLRFVPDDERAYNPRRQQIQVVGHWAHGEELGRWYAARDTFYASAPPRCRPTLRRLVGVREPGEDG